MTVGLLLAKLGNRVRMHIAGMRGIVTRRPTTQLETVLSQITLDNLHGEVDWGSAQGKEAC